MIRTNYQKVDLPQNYAWELLNNEIQFQLGQNVTINLVQKLIQLYALGVEYYQSLRSYKYLYFQKKMNSLMKSPQVMKSMEEQIESPTKQPQNLKKQENTQKNENQLKIMVSKQKQQKMEKIMFYETSQINTSKVKEIIQNTQKQAQQYQQKVKNQINQQNDKIKQKISRRRTLSKSGLYKSFSAVSSSSDLASCQNLFIESPVKKLTGPDRIQKITVDFSGIINQNQDEEDKPGIKKC